MPIQRRIGHRKNRIVAAAGLIAVLAACGAPTTNQSAGESTGDVPDKPSKAVTLNILDVAGNLQLTQGMIDDFVKQHPDVISKVTYSKAPAPELAGKIKAQQNANRVDLDLVLTGTDGLAAGREQGLWTDLLPKYADRVAGMKDYLPPAAEDAGAGRQQRYHRHLLPVRPAARVPAGQGPERRPRRPRSCSPTRRPTRARSCTPARPTPAPAAPS